MFSIILSVDARGTLVMGGAHAAIWIQAPVVCMILIYSDVLHAVVPMVAGEGGQTAFVPIRVMVSVQPPLTIAVWYIINSAMKPQQAVIHVLVAPLAVASEPPGSYVIK
jgi:hypothetical protein